MPGKNPATAANGHAFAGGGKLSAAVPAINHCRPGGFAVRRVHGCKISCSRAAAPGRNRHGVGGIFCIGQRSGGLVGPAKGSQQQQSAVCDLGVFEPSCQRQHYRVGLVRRLTIAVDPRSVGPLASCSRRDSHLPSIPATRGPSPAAHATAASAGHSRRRTAPRRELRPLRGQRSGEAASVGVLLTGAFLAQRGLEASLHRCRWRGGAGQCPLTAGWRSVGLCLDCR